MKKRHNLNNPLLDVYYDNPNEASDMYLKHLKKDCEANGIEVRVFDNLCDWEDAEENGDGELYLEPIATTDIMINWHKNSIFNVDRDSATATGICEHIKETYPRKTVIGVIGRGLVGKQLINKLIDCGYTVLEFNSQTDSSTLYGMCYGYCDIIVGLATSDKPIFGEGFCNNLTKKGVTLIDASNNFDTKNKLRCGKWTRDVIVRRVIENFDTFNKRLNS